MRNPGAAAIGAGSASHGATPPAFDLRRSKSEIGTSARTLLGQCSRDDEHGSEVPHGQPELEPLG